MAPSIIRTLQLTTRIQYVYSINYALCLDAKINDSLYNKIIIISPNPLKIIIIWFSEQKLAVCIPKAGHNTRIRSIRNMTKVNTNKFNQRYTPISSVLVNLKLNSTNNYTCLVASLHFVCTHVSSE